MWPKSPAALPSFTVRPVVFLCSKSAPLTNQPTVMGLMRYFILQVTFTRQFYVLRDNWCSTCFGFVRFAIYDLCFTTIVMARLLLSNLQLVLSAIALTQSTIYYSHSRSLTQSRFSTLKTREVFPTSILAYLVFSSRKSTPHSVYYCRALPRQSSKGFTI